MAQVSEDTEKNMNEFESKKNGESFFSIICMGDHSEDMPRNWGLSFPRKGDTMVALHLGFLGQTMFHLIVCLELFLSLPI